MEHVVNRICCIGQLEHAQHHTLIVRAEQQGIVGGLEGPGKDGGRTHKASAFYGGLHGPVMVSLVHLEVEKWLLNRIWLSL